MDAADDSGSDDDDPPKLTQYELDRAARMAKNAARMRVC